MKNVIGKNSLYSLLKSFSQVIFPLITFPYISRTLLAENVGKYNFANSIVIYISLIATLGITTYAVRECAKVRDNKDELNRIASEIISINMITTAIAYIVLAVVLFFVEPFQNYMILILILSINVLFTTLGADWINTAMEDFKYITIRTFIFQLVSLVAMFCLVHKPEDYIIFAVITVFSMSGGNILNIFYRKKYVKTIFTLRIRWRKHVAPITLLFAMILSQTIFSNTDIIMIGLYKGDFEVGLYSTAIKIYNLVNGVIASIAWVMMPQMSYYFLKNDYKEINKLFKYAMNFIAILGIPSIVGINVLCSEIIEVVGGPEYLGATMSVHILSLALAVSLLGGLIGNIILLPSMREYKFLKACIWAAVINIIGNYFLIPIFGMNASAFMAFVSQTVAFIICLKNMDKNVSFKGMKGILFAPVMGSFCFAVVVSIVLYIVDSLWIRIGASVLLSVIIYVVILIVLKNEFTIQILDTITLKIRKKQRA